MTKDLGYWAHETAIVDSGAKVGAGTKIWHFSHVCGNDVEIGPDCSLGQNVYVAPRTRIGRGSRLQNNVSLYDLVTLEDYVFCGPSVVFTNVVNPRAHISRKDEFKATVVRRGCSLGANSTIVCGITLGRFAFVGAGAVITKDVADFALMIGVPARRVGWMCHCGIRLGHQVGRTLCEVCGSEYVISSNQCVDIRLNGAPA